MAVTAGGSPYVEASDLVAAYPAVSLDLAEHVDTKANTASPALTGQATITGTVPAYLMVESDASNAQGQVFHNAGQLFLNADNNNVAAGSAVNLNVDGTNRFKINTDGLITGSGQSLGAGTAYTPVISGTGWALGNGTITGAYSAIGKMVYFDAKIIFGSTSTFGGSALQISLPFTAIDEKRINARFTDSSAGTNFFGTGIVASDVTTTVTIWAIQSAAGLIEPVISSKPFTWANTDIIKIDGWYRST
jgi:hypothetical protein